MVNIFSGQPWWHIVFLRTFISRAVSSENVKMLRLYETGDLEKRKILNLLSMRWDKIAIGDIYKKNYPKGDLKVYRGIGVSMLGAPFQPEK